VYPYRHLVSWRSIVETEEYSHPLATPFPTFFARPILPQIAKSIEPREVVVAGALDAGGEAGRPRQHRMGTIASGQVGTWRR
jgi:hypothetical protein